MKKGLHERIDEGVLRWFGHVERIERDGVAKRVCVGVYGGVCEGECVRRRPGDEMPQLYEPL